MSQHTPEQVEEISMRLQKIRAQAADAMTSTSYIAAGEQAIRALPVIIAAVDAYAATLRQRDEQSCTCHPDDNPPRPCPRKYALTECRQAALASQQEQITDGKAQWDEVAGILGADGDNVDDVTTKARALAAQQKQGEAVYQCMCTDPNLDEDGNKHEDDGSVWMDVSKNDYDSLSKRPDVRHRIVYARPASPAGVPELTVGQQAVAAELLCCFTAWEPSVRVLGNVRARDAADLLRTIVAAAAPSAPEGDGGAE